MNIEMASETIGQLVRKDYRMAQVFKSYKIDFCCGGAKTIEQVCSERDLNPTKILTELSNAQNQNAEAIQNFDEWPLDLLIDYIEKKHHKYVEANSPVLRQYLKKLAAVHSDEAPYLIEIESIFIESTGALAQHMKKEELILFPKIRNLVSFSNSNKSINRSRFGSVQNPINMMEDEHETEGDNFKRIEEISNSFEVPDWGCNTYAVSMNLLREFQDDLHLHIHLENNILFPKAIALEQELADSSK